MLKRVEQNTEGTYIPGRQEQRMSSGLRKSLLMIAEESEKTKKARKKLKSKLDGTDKKMTEKAIKDKSLQIAGWIERHLPDRISVEKEISLFDQNRNSAKMSRVIEKMAQELSIELQNQKRNK